MTKQVAIVKFPNSLNGGWAPNPKQYNFITDIEGLNEGDTVVVDTQHGLQIAIFVKYDSLGFGNTGAKTPVKWLITKVDLEKHKARVQAQAELEKLRVMMETQRKKAQELEIYEILAQKNPEMASLLDSYKKLQEVL